MFDSVSVIFLDSRSDTQKNGRRVETSSGLASLRKFYLDSIADYEANAHGVFKSFKRMVTSAELGNASEYKEKFEAFKKALEDVKTIFKDHKLGYSVDELFDIYFKIKSACHVISKKMEYKKNHM